MAPAANHSGYNTFLGDSADYNQTSSAAMYNATGAVWSAWAGEACTATQAAVCELAAHKLAGSCPVAPPSAPPPAVQPTTGICEWQEPR